MLFKTTLAICTVKTLQCYSSSQPRVPREVRYGIREL